MAFTKKKCLSYLSIFLISVAYAHVAHPFDVLYITVPQGIIIGGLIISSTAIIK